MNKANERYNTKVEIPISVILETIFSDDNHDVETLCRWAKHYGFVDLIEKDKSKYYQLQDDYKKQSFYIWLSKEERKQYDYEDYLLDENERLNNIINEFENKGYDIAQERADFLLEIDRLNNIIKEVREYIENIENNRKGLSVTDYHKWLEIYDYYESGSIMGDILEILDKENK